MSALVVGLTGILGSGKSTVAKTLEQRGASIVDMDVAGRWAVENDLTVLDNLRRKFPTAFDEHEQLERKKLGDIVFSNPVALQKLNAIVHPAMLNRARHLIEKEKTASDCLYIVVDAALIFELEFEQECDLVVTVASPIELCLERARAFKGLTQQQAIDRIGSQMPQDEKIKRSDYVIHNDSTVEDLTTKINDLHRWLLDKAKR